jgi:hypothetical protein
VAADNRLGDFNAAAFNGWHREATGWLARFEAEPELVDAVVTQLTQVPEVLASCRTELSGRHRKSVGG